MEGITILNEYTKNLNSGNLLCGILTGVVALFCLFYIITSIVTHDGEDIGWVIVALIIFGFLSVLALTNSYYKPQHCYQVIISEDVRMQEFNEQYEILSQEGQIFTIAEK